MITGIRSRYIDNKKIIIICICFNAIFYSVYIPLLSIGAQNGNKNLSNGGNGFLVVYIIIVVVMFWVFFQ